MDTRTSKGSSAAVEPGSFAEDNGLDSFTTPPAEEAEVRISEASPALTKRQAAEPDTEASVTGSSGGTVKADSAAGVLGRAASLLASALRRAPARRGDASTPVASRKAAVIRLAPGDDISVVRAKLRTVSERKVVLAVPGATQLFRREVDFALVRRCVAEEGLALALVSRDSRVRTLARRYGFPVSSFVGRARKKAGSLTRRRVEGRKAHLAVRYRLSSRPKARGGWEEWLLLLVLILGAALATAAGALLVWPQATVTIVPQGGIVEQQVQLVADPSTELVDEETRRIPARLIRTEMRGEAQVSTLGYQDAPDAKATGQAVFINRTNGPVEITQGTVLATSAGTTIKFATVEGVTLAAGLGSVGQARIEALDPGPSGNVGPYLINRVADAALAPKVRVANEQPTEGGSVRQVGVVTAADRERLRAMLLRQVHQEAHAKLEAELAPEEFLPIESVSVVVLDETYDHLLGEMADSLGMTMRVQVQGVVFDLAQARRMARTVLQGAIPRSRALHQESFYAEVVQAAVKVPDPNEPQLPGVELVMKARGWTEAIITPGRVIQLIQGRPIPDALAELETRLPLGEAPLLSVEPEWWDRVPWLPFRIRVIVASEKR